MKVITTLPLGSLGGEVMRSDCTAAVPVLVPGVLVTKGEAAARSSGSESSRCTPIAARVTGSMVVEQIFAIPGLGRYFVDSVAARDYPVIMGTTLLYAVVLVISNLLVDISYTLIDPRIRLEDAA